MTGRKSGQIVGTVGARDRAGGQIAGSHLLSQHGGAQYARTVHRDASLQAPQCFLRGRLAVEPFDCRHFIARQPSLHANTARAVEKHRRATHRRMFESEKMSYLVRGRAFNEIHRGVRAVEIRGPAVLDAVEHDVRLDLRIVVRKIAVECGGQQIADVVQPAIDERAVLRPKDHILIVAGVDINTRRDESRILELQESPGDRLPLRERSADGVQLSHGVCRRIGVRSEKEPDRLGRRIHDIRVNSLVRRIRWNRRLGRIEMPAQWLAGVSHLHDKCPGTKSPEHQERQPDGPARQAQMGITG